MSAEGILRKLKRAMRNQTGATLTADQVCELIDYGLLDTLSAISNGEVKAEARERLEAAQAAEPTKATSNQRHEDLKWIARLTRSA